MTTVLVDADHVIFDWAARWDEMHYERHASMFGVPKSSEMTVWNFREGLEADAIQVIDRIMNDPSFYKRGEIIPGAAEALQAMLDEGYEVFIVTSPTITNPTCASDKLAWIESHVGPGWAKRTIITSDKTLIRGDILIDDKDVITGAMEPTWTQIVFDAPHNQHLIQTADFDKQPSWRLIDWGGWRTVVQAVLDERESVMLSSGHTEFMGDWPADELTDEAFVVKQPRLVPPHPSILRDLSEAYISGKPELNKVINPSPAGVSNGHVFVAAPNSATGEKRVTSATGGQKGSKPQRTDLLPIGPMLEVAKLYGIGAAKYSDSNWRKGYAWSLSYASLLRHAFAFWNGEDIDPELGTHHMASVVFHAFALLEFAERFPQYDDRFKPQEGK